jgi:hypothetical protein
VSDNLLDIPFAKIPPAFSRICIISSSEDFRWLNYMVSCNTHLLCCYIVKLSLLQ